MLTVFDITANNQNVFTTIKTDADNFVIGALFCGEVEINYKKFKMDEKAFEKELSKRKKLEDLKQIGLA